MSAGFFFIFGFKCLTIGFISSFEIFAFAHFSHTWCNRLKLVADELFMNAVNYGSKENESFVFITFSFDNQEMQFVIEDEGKGNKQLKPVF